MKLIRKLGTRLSKTGRKQSWAVYEYLDCLQEVEKLLGNGEKQISCGCERKKVIVIQDYMLFGQI